MSLLLILSILSPLIPLCIGFKKNKQTLLWFYPLIGFVFDVLISFLKRGLHVNYQWPTNIFILTEFLLLSQMYRSEVFKNKKTFQILTITMAILFIIHTISTSIWRFNMTGTSIFYLTYIVFGIGGLYTILKKQDILYLEKSWFFWLNIAIIIYSSGTFLLFLFRDYMVNIDKEMYLSLWNNIFLVLNIIKNLLLAVSLYHLGKDIKHEPR